MDLSQLKYQKIQEGTTAATLLQSSYQIDKTMKFTILSIATALLTSDNALASECESEIEALYENTDLLAAFTTLVQSCPASTEGTTVKQDYGSCDTGPVQSACTAAGGKIKR